MPDLTPWIVAHCRAKLGKTFNREHLDYVSAFKADPELLAHARAEHARIAGLNSALGGKLVQRDYNQHMQMETIAGMLANYEEVTK
jgi:hypothetical protein